MPDDTGGDCHADGGLCRLKSTGRARGGILCSFVGLLFTVTIRFAMNIHWDWPHLALAAAAFAALVFELDILWVVLGGTAISAFAF